MHNESKIECLGVLGKLVIDFSSMEEIKKLAWKIGIDFAADNLKRFVRNPTYVQQIQKTAQQCNLERVVVFQCLVNGEEKLLFKLNGGDILAFCQCMGIQVFPEITVPMVLPYISKANEQRGIVLYERKR